MHLVTHYSMFHGFENRFECSDSLGHERSCYLLILLGVRASAICSMTEPVSEFLEKVRRD